MQRKNGYFTVEAAMVLPMVMGAILFLVYLLLFQYNRCLLEQDMGAMAMWGSTVAIRDEEALTQEIENRTRSIFWEKYTAWEMLKMDVSVDGNTFRVEGCGQIGFPVPGWNFWNRENVWSVEVGYAYDRKSPVDFIRMCNRILEMTEE